MKKKVHLQHQLNEHTPSYLEGYMFCGLSTLSLSPEQRTYNRDEATCKTCLFRASRVLTQPELKTSNFAGDHKDIDGLIG